MIDTSAIAQGDALRAEIESATAAFLRSGGEVKIVDSLVIKPKPEKPASFNNSTNAEADARSRARGSRNSAKAAGGNTEYHRAIRRRNVEQIVPLLATGMSAAEMSAHIGITPRAINHIIKVEGLRA
jgi:hypothetical protein